ncbi:acetylhydrolase [Streptomyces mirabilis]|uniref:alpha/beta hydrolase family protein n=1 Tax=Streptomyces TaxID=1883 RepID=UPI000BCA0CC5|nr:MULTISPECIES: acetylhydrolase [unclassified Streptomyces]SOF02567.1 Platelet-activating factor acetylhydrolase, isoform II [Streptomyces sp. OV198]
MSITSVTKTDLTRRRMFAAALAAGVGAAVPISAARQAWAAPTAPGSSRLTLPRPTGPHPVGTVPLHLVDTSRPDPVAGPGHHRELMAGVWYPARRAEGLPRAPWMTEGALRALLTDAGFSLDPALGPLTAAHVGAPVHHAGHRLPVIVYSHGSGSHRGDHTIMVQELASRGYAVVTVDHTHDTFTEFPDGRVLTPDDVPMYPRDFAADLRFLLDCVEGLAAGRNPDADGKPLPQGLLGALDPKRIGAFGWSKGGTATALTMLADQRVRAGLSLDGPMQPTITADLDRPFMMMTAVFTRDAMPDVAEFWTHLRGWRLDIQAGGAIHPSYGDNVTLIPQAGKILGMTDQQIQDMIGTLDPARAVRIQQAYPLAFFDLHLRHRRERLLDGPSTAFPEVKFIP